MAKLHTITTQLQRVVFDIEAVVGWKLMTQSEVLEIYCAGIQPITVAGQQAVETERILSEALTGGDGQG